MVQTRSQVTLPSDDISEMKSRLPNCSLLTDYDLNAPVSYLLRVRQYINGATGPVICIQAKRIKDRAVLNMENRVGTFWYNEFVIEICDTIIQECRKSDHL
jgi:hypothetical protein